MNSRTLQTIESVMKSLESLQSPRGVKADKIGNQAIYVSGNVVVHKNAEGKFDLPPTTSETLESMRKELKLELNNSINIKSTSKNGATLLIEAVMTGQDEAVTVLLNHGADPTICDDDDNNAFIHASKKANSKILKDLRSLIRLQEKEKAKKEEAATDEKVDASHSDLSKIEKSQPLAAQVSHTTQAEELNERLVLDPEVLSHKNKAGETAVKILEQYTLASPKPVKNDKKSNKPQLPRLQQASPRPHESDVLNRFTLLVDGLQIINPPNLKQQIHVNEGEHKAESKLAEKNDPTYQEKVRRAQHTYDGFFNKNLAAHNVTSKKIASRSPEINSSRTREKIRVEKVKLNDTALPKFSPELLPATLPIIFQDHARLQSAFDLIKDYFAPQSAPFLKSMQWNGLRRLFTCHTGRRYVKEAESFYNKLLSMPCATPSDIVTIYDTIMKKYEELRALNHDKKDSNTIFNSSFTHRLYYASEQLKKTQAYEAFQAELTDDDYLNIFDGNNRDHGLLAEQPVQHRPRQ
jgi:hypothetical protein